VSSVAAVVPARSDTAGSPVPASEANVANDQGQRSFSQVLSQQAGAATGDAAASPHSPSTVPPSMTDDSNSYPSRTSEPSTSPAVAASTSDVPAKVGDGQSSTLALVGGDEPGPRPQVPAHGASPSERSKSKTTAPASGEKRSKRSDTAPSDAGALGVGPTPPLADNSPAPTKKATPTGEVASPPLAQDGLSSTSVGLRQTGSSEPKGSTSSSLTTPSAEGDHASSTPQARSASEARHVDSFTVGTITPGAPRAVVAPLAASSVSPPALVPRPSDVANEHSRSLTSILHATTSDRATSKSPDVAGGSTSLSASASPSPLVTGAEAAASAQTSGVNALGANPSISHVAIHSFDSLTNSTSHSPLSGLTRQSVAGLDVGGLSSNLSRPLSQGNGTYSILVAMQPANLGHVHAVMSLTGNDLHVSLTPDASVAHAALSHAINDLKSELGRSGLNVSVDLQNSQSQASDEGWRRATPDHAIRFETPTPGASSLPAKAEDVGLIHVLL